MAGWGSGLDAIDRILGVEFAIKSIQPALASLFDGRGGEVAEGFHAIADMALHFNWLTFIWRASHPALDRVPHRQGSVHGVFGAGFPVPCFGGRKLGVRSVGDLGYLDVFHWVPLGYLSQCSGISPARTA